jgi:hypothetical protein
MDWPHPQSWLDRIDPQPCRDVYAYQGALLCDDCAGRVVEQLRRDGTGDDGDSDTYPQGPCTDGGGEADSPQHCAAGAACSTGIVIPGDLKVGCPLGNPLTEDGRKYVIESVASGILARETHKRAMGRLWRHLYDEVEPGELIALSSPNTPSNLGTLLDEITPRHARIPRELYTDLDYLYGAAVSDEDVALWRAEITPEGNFAHLETVLLPAAEFPGRTIEEAIGEAVNDGAWD